MEGNSGGIFLLFSLLPLFCTVTPDIIFSIDKGKGGEKPGGEATGTLQFTDSWRKLEKKYT